jgi:hypothetical protein
MSASTISHPSDGPVTPDPIEQQILAEIVGLQRLKAERIREAATLKAAAEAAYALGWSLVVLNIDKHPVVPAWKDYQMKRAPLDHILKCTQYQGAASLAVITGALSGVVVLDFDGPAGLATMRKLNLEPHLCTGSGGFHVYVKHPGFYVPTLNGKTVPKLAVPYPGMDVRGDGGLAIIAGRNHNGEYVWLS